MQFNLFLFFNVVDLNTERWCYLAWVKSYADRASARQLTFTAIVIVCNDCIRGSFLALRARADSGNELLLMALKPPDYD